MVDICKLQQMAATSFKKDATGKDNFHNLHTIGWPLAKRTVGGENFFLSNYFFFKFIIQIFHIGRLVTKRTFLYHILSANDLDHPH